MLGSKLRLSPNIRRIIVRGDPNSKSLRLGTRQQDSSDKPRAKGKIRSDNDQSPTTLLDDLNEPWTHQEIKSAMEVKELREDLIQLVVSNIQQSIQQIKADKGHCFDPVIQFRLKLENWR
jgi:hypothetical protein